MNLLSYVFRHPSFFLKLILLELLLWFWWYVYSQFNNNVTREVVSGYGLFILAISTKSYNAFRRGWHVISCEDTSVIIEHEGSRFGPSIIRWLPTRIYSTNKRDVSLLSSLLLARDVNSVTVSDKVFCG